MQQETSNINRGRSKERDLKKLISQAVQPSCDWRERQAGLRLGACSSGAGVNSQNLILLDFLFISLLYSSDGGSFIEIYTLYTACDTSLSHELRHSEPYHCDSGPLRENVI